MVIPFQPPIVVRLTITKRRRRRISHSFIIYRSKQTNQPTSQPASQPSTTLWERAVLMVLIINRNWCCNKKIDMLHFPGQIPKQYHLEKKMEQLLWWSLAQQAAGYVVCSCGRKNQSACHTEPGTICAASRHICSNDIRCWTLKDPIYICIKVAISLICRPKNTSQITQKTRIIH